MSFLNDQIADWFVTVGKKKAMTKLQMLCFICHFMLPQFVTSHARLHITEVPVVCHVIEEMLVAIHYQFAKDATG